MLSSRVRIQLIAFAVIAVVSVTYAAFRFTSLSALFGGDGYTVVLELADSGGIFTNAEVTYRGVTVGRVGDIRLTATGIEVDLDIDATAPDIPADLDAVVANRSAVGEQYVDLRPRGGAGPYLSDSSVITADRTRTPVSTDTVLRTVDSLARSVPTDALRVVVDEMYQAFSGTAYDLQTLLDTTREFTAAARDNLPQTIQLIDTGGTVLDTQNAQATNFTAFSRDLRLLAEQLSASDQDFRELISATPKAATTVSTFLLESGNGLGVLFANLLTTSSIVAVRNDGLEYALVAYPVLAAAGQGLLRDGTAHLGLALNLFHPPPCTKGYEATPTRSGNETGPGGPLPDQTYCAEPPGSPINVRGSANAPFNGVPAPPPRSDGDAGEPGRVSDPMGRVLPGSLAGPGVGPATLASLLGLPG